MQSCAKYGNIVSWFFETIFHILCGALAQLGAHHTGSVGVRGSNPLCSTSVPLKSIRPSLYKANACTTRHAFGCCAVCSTKSSRFLAECSKGHSAVLFALWRVILLRSYICLSTSVITCGSLMANKISLKP